MFRGPAAPANGAFAPRSLLAKRWAPESGLNYPDLARFRHAPAAQVNAAHEGGARNASWAFGAACRARAPWTERERRRLNAVIISTRARYSS
eukprot:6085089-Pyramimonas_sp.AAC.1